MTLNPSVSLSGMDFELGMAPSIGLVVLSLLSLIERKAGCPSGAGDAPEA